MKHCDDYTDENETKQWHCCWNEYYAIKQMTWCLHSIPMLFPFIVRFIPWVCVYVCYTNKKNLRALNRIRLVHWKMNVSSKCVQFTLNRQNNQCINMFNFRFAWDKLTKISNLNKIFLRHERSYEKPFSFLFSPTTDKIFIVLFCWKWL